jgi:hypothetical protein
MSADPGPTLLTVTTHVHQLLSDEVKSLRVHREHGALVDAAWEGLSAKFGLVLSTLADHEYLSDTEDRFVEVGLYGAEFALLTSVFETQRSSASGWDPPLQRTAFSILRTMSALPILGASCMAIMAFGEIIATIANSGEK